MLTFEIPGGETLELAHLVLDINGTLADHGTLIDGVADRLGLLGEGLEIHLLTADTFGAGAGIAAALGLRLTRIATGADKVAVVERLGPDRVAAIGNGQNDEGMLRAARVGIAVIGPEGAAAGALRAADLVCRSATDALDLLLDGRALAASLRP